ncbi:MAG: helix-turn-helix domain-containing protein [Pseudomonadaceae bacterium]|nr:helix-turn-helix domain-containing protein [Pseudomonadaceae bacterium]
MNKEIDLETIANAIELDAGETIPELRQALAEAQSMQGRITTPEQILVRQARERTGLTQTLFAHRISTPVATLRDWEQGRFTPPGGVLYLLRLLAKHPDLSNELVN